MSRFKCMAPSLVEDWARVAAQIRSSCRIFVFLDFDGTLVNIAPLPDQVRLAPTTRRVLGRLARHPRVTLVVISGRRRSELRRYIGLPGIRYYGLYGWERSGHSPLPSSALRALRSAQSKLSIHLSSIPGIWVENKYFSLSIHFLAASPLAQRQARRKLRSLLLPFQKTLRVRSKTFATRRSFHAAFEGKESRCNNSWPNRRAAALFLFILETIIRTKMLSRLWVRGFPSVLALHVQRERVILFHVPAAVAAVLAKLEAALI